jgi:uncharacterized protein YneF (UPF0154 family)
MTQLPALLSTGIVAATLGTVGGAWIAERQLEAKLAHRPPIAVIDYTPLTELMVQRFQPEDLLRLDVALNGFKAEARALAASGYLVLNRSVIEDPVSGVLVVRPALEAGPTVRAVSPPVAQPPRSDPMVLQELLR